MLRKNIFMRNESIFKKQVNNALPGAFFFLYFLASFQFGKPFQPVSGLNAMDLNILQPDNKGASCYVARALLNFQSMMWCSYMYTFLFQVQLSKTVLDVFKCANMYLTDVNVLQGEDEAMFVEYRKQLKLLLDRLAQVSPELLLASVRRVFNTTLQ